jgi:ribosome-binding protein aMBF1 (putative translation factor)
MATGRWAKIRERTINTPEEKARYEVTKRAIIKTRQLLMEIEVARERAGLSKAELARRMSADPSAIRRVFSSPTSNPTLRTVLDMLSALDLNFEIRPSNPITLPVQRESADELAIRAGAGSTEA